MLKMNDDLEGALKEFIVLLDNEEYFEAHEVLEEAWHPLRLKDDPLKNVVKGLINGAISLEHLKRNKKDALLKAQKVIKSYDRYKDVIEPKIKYYNLFKKASLTLDRLRAGKY